MGNWQRRVGVVALGSTVVGFLCALPYILGDGAHESPLAIMINWWIWALLLPVIILFDRSLPYTTKQPLRLYGSHLVFGPVLTIGYVVVAADLEYWLGLNKWEPWSHALGLLNWFVQGLLTYTMIFGALQAQKYFRRHAEDEVRLERLERRFAEAQILAIRSQLDPHFIFNTLNTISSQLERDPESARSMVEGLAELLRMSFDSQNRQDITLDKEVGFLRRYVDIQKTRFADRLQVKIDIAPAARSAYVPSLLLQPLVENAIRHGISNRAAGGHIVVIAARVGDLLEIRVEDDGEGLPAGWRLEEAKGLGLKATHARVVNSSPDGRAVMSVMDRAGGGTSVRIFLPFRSNIQEAQNVVSAA